MYNAAAKGDISLYFTPEGFIHVEIFVIFHYCCCFLFFFCEKIDIFFRQFKYKGYYGTLLTIWRWNWAFRVPWAKRVVLQHTQSCSGLLVHLLWLRLSRHWSFVFSFLEQRLEKTSWTPRETKGCADICCPRSGETQRWSLPSLCAVV